MKLVVFKNTKREYFNNLDLRVFDDNISFWKTVKPLFSDKQRSAKNKIILVEENGNYIISDENEVAEKLNNLFADTVKNLDIEKYIPDYEQSNADICDIIDRYSQHPSVLKIMNILKQVIYFISKALLPKK